MSDPTTTDTDQVPGEPLELIAEGVAGLTGVHYNIDGDVVDTAIRNAVVAAGVQPVGQHGLAFLVPDGYKLEVRDARDLTDDVRPLRRRLELSFIGVRSLAGYVNTYKSDATRVYLRDLTGKGTKVLTDETAWVVSAVLDEHPADGTDHREHRAGLTLRPTTAGSRWGAALARDYLTQDDLLDLIADGIGEIAKPDGATLHDLIADLHAIRTSEAKSVRRTGGESTITVSENVGLHGGTTGDSVTIPDQITVVFDPFAGITTKPVVLTVTVKPKVTAQTAVVFGLEAPALDDEIARTLGEIAAQLTEATGIEPLWVP